MLNSADQDVICRTVSVAARTIIDKKGDVKADQVTANHLTVNAQATLNGSITEPKHAVTKEYVDAFRAIGDIKFSAVSSDHQGWLKCDGRSVLRASYPALFALIGNSFGSDDVLHFKLPDCRSRVLGAIGQSGMLSNRQAGEQAGQETHALNTLELPSHTHSGTTAADGVHNHAITDPGHTHSQTTINDDFNSSGANPPGFASDSAGSRTWNNISSSTTGISLANSASHTHTFTTGPTGSNQAFGLLQPTLFIANVFILAQTF